MINDNFLVDLKDKAEEETIFNQKMQEAVAKSEFMELTKNLHRKKNNLRFVINKDFTRNL